MTTRPSIKPSQVVRPSPRNLSRHFLTVMLLTGATTFSLSSCSKKPPEAPVTEEDASSAPKELPSARESATPAQESPTPAGKASPSAEKSLSAKKPTPSAKESPVPATKAASSAEQLPTSAEAGSNVDGTNIIIYKKEGAFTPFPSLRESTEGALVTRFTSRATHEHIRAEGAEHIQMESKDGGQTWTQIPFSGTKFVHPEWETKSGDWVRVRDEGRKYAKASEREALEKKGYRTRDAGPGRIGYLTPFYLVERSSDGGENWETTKVRAPDYVQSLYHFYPSHSTVRTEAGTHVRALYGHAVGSDKNEVFILRSDDDGKTWDFVRVQPNGPGELGFDESALIETSDNRLLLMMRSAPMAYLWQSFSDDEGKTWSKPVSSGIIGHPAHLLKLADGRILCSYGYRRHPMGVRASISNDNGKTWEVGSEFVLRSDGKHRPGDQGYPTTVQLDDGSLFTIYYITRADNNTHIAGTKWRLPEKQAVAP